MNSSRSSRSYSDIISSSAERDDDRDGKAVWYTLHLWIYGGGKRHTYSICDSDGSHKSCAKREADQFCRDERQSWLDYAAYVAETGEDPLGNYHVDRETRVDETWTTTLQTWIGSRKLGLRIKSVKRKGDKTDTPNQFLPEYVREYLEMKRKGGISYCEGIHSFDEVCPTGDDKLTGRGTTRKITFTLDRRIPFPAAQIRANLIAAANLHIAGEKAFDAREASK